MPILPGHISAIRSQIVEFNAKFAAFSRSFSDPVVYGLRLTFAWATGKPAPLMLGAGGTVPEDVGNSRTPMQTPVLVTGTATREQQEGETKPGMRQAVNASGFGGTWAP
jgi:hypothetical protein